MTPGLFQIVCMQSIKGGRTRSFGTGVGACSLAGRGFRQYNRAQPRPLEVTYFMSKPSTFIDVGRVPRDINAFNIEDIGAECPRSGPEYL